METTMALVDITNMSEDELDAVFDSAIEAKNETVLVVSIVKLADASVHAETCARVTKMSARYQALRGISKTEMIKDIQARGYRIGSCRCLSKTKHRSMRMG